MTVRYQENKVDSCRINADLEGSTYSFNVAPEAIEESTKVIKETYEYLSVDCKRVYIAGFECVTPSTNLTREQLIDRVIFSTEMMNKAKGYAGKEQQVNVVRQ